MRIGLVMAELPQYSETFLNSKIKGLMESGFDVTVFAGPGVKQKTFYPHVRAFAVRRNKLLQAVYSVLILSLTFLRAPGPVIRFWKLQKREGRSTGQALKNIYESAHILPRKIDWLHYTFLTFAVGRETLAKAIGARMAGSIRGFDITIYPLKNPGCFKKTWSYLDRLHTISDGLIDRARAAGMPADFPYKKVTPAISAIGFQPKENPGSLATPVRLLTVGRLHWIKGYEYAIIALRSLKEAGIDFRYTIVGTGTELERLTYAVHTFGLQDNVHFAGKLSHEEVQQQLRRADIYLQPSIDEGFCNAVLEAQLSGLLCIVSDAKGLRENVLHGITGWMVPRRDPEALSRAILDVIRMPQEQRGLVTKAAIDRVKNEFNLDVQKKGFAEFYKEGVH